MLQSSLGVLIAWTRQSFSYSRSLDTRWTPCMLGFIGYGSILNISSPIGIIRDMIRLTKVGNAKYINT